MWGQQGRHGWRTRQACAQPHMGGHSAARQGNPQRRQQQALPASPRPLTCRRRARPPRAATAGATARCGPAGSGRKREWGGSVLAWPGSEGSETVTLTHATFHINQDQLSWATNNPRRLTMLALKGVRKPSVPMAKEMTGGSGASSEPNREARCSTVPSPVGQTGRDAANYAFVVRRGGRDITGRPGAAQCRRLWDRKNRNEGMC